MRQQKTFGCIAFALLAVLLLSACSSEENTTPSTDIAVTDAHINISVAPFDAPSKKKLTSRSVGTDEEKADTVVLANGMRAICTVEEDEKEASTRAMPISDGNYTIYACKPDGTRITGIKKILKGTVTGGKFKTAPGSHLSLAPGTYKFVCINDAVEDHGTWLQVTSLHDNYNPFNTQIIASSKPALIGTTTETISGNNLKISFVMRHQNARLRIRLVAYTEHLDNVHGVITDDFSHQTYSMKYNIDGSNPTMAEYTGGYGTVTLSGFTLPNTSTKYHTKYVKAHEFMSSDMYVCPGGEEFFDKGYYIRGIKGKFYGETIFVDGLNSGQGMQDLHTKANHSYTVTIRLLPKDNALYLFQDGTCGALLEKGGRTPIGVVVKEKTNQEDGIAMALNKTQNGDPVTPNGDFNKDALAIADAMNDMRGHYYTWDGASTPNGKVKATALESGNPIYLSFYEAAHYNPGVATTNIGQWYLPALGEWKLAFQQLGNVDIADMVPGYDMYGPNTVSWIKSNMKRVFTPVGGTALDGYDEYESSTMFNLTHLTCYLQLSDNYILVSSESVNNHSIVPFVHF